MRQTFFLLVFLGLSSTFFNLGHSQGLQKSQIGLTLLPPSPVTDQITLDVRAGIYNNGDLSKEAEVIFYLDQVIKEKILYRGKVSLQAHGTNAVTFQWPTKNHAGYHKIILLCKTGNSSLRTQKSIQIIASNDRSTRRIDGAFLGFYHWSETEGKHWNPDIKKMTNNQWRELIDAQHKLGMDIVVMQELFRNQMYVGEHKIESEGYKGRAYYPSKLFPERMPISATDPVEAVLSEADKNGMYVFVAVGLYAWFDFTQGSLEWHQKVAKELWERYGHHPSFYGWYVSEEMDGGLGTEQQREDIVHFFHEFSAYVHRLSPDKPVMLATNSHHIHSAEATYAKLLPSLDILCPFGFHRMPKEDYTGEQAAEVLQKLCDHASTHLWMDMEVFDFAPDSSLVPRSIKGLLSDLTRFPIFEKIICYQFPGLLNSPDMSIKPGGEETVKLYLDYKKYLQDNQPSKK